jgi:hypothetical protein
MGNVGAIAEELFRAVTRPDSVVASSVTHASNAGVPEEVHPKTAGAW